MAKRGGRERLRRVRAGSARARYKCAREWVVRGAGGLEGLEERVLLSQVVFDAPTLYANAAGILTADFNGDGKADLATADAFENSWSILLGNGDGTFLPRKAFSSERRAYVMAVADVNGDGKVDVFLSVEGGMSIKGAVNVALNNGDGTFAAGVPVFEESDLGSLDVLATDFTGDGKADLAVVDFRYQQLHLLKGNGDGTFQAQADYATPADSFAIHSLASADFNRDGMQDLVVVNRKENSVSVYLNDGTGDFLQRADYVTGVEPDGVAVADVNGDGVMDLVVTNNLSGTVSVFTGNGDGSFKAKLDFATGSLPTDVAAVDLNGDGKVDLAVTDSGTEMVSVLLNDGGGGFEPKVDYAGGGRNELCTADFNGDGRADMVVTYDYRDTVSILLNHGNGTFPAQNVVPGNPYALPFFQSDTPAAVGDFTGDGKPDVVMVDRKVVSVSLNKGDGRYADAVQIPTSGQDPVSVAATDFTGDGILDLEVVYWESATIGIIAGNGDGTFGDGTPSAWTMLPTSTQPFSVIAADVNGDGQMDLVVRYQFKTFVSVLLNNGTGTFMPRASYTIGGVATSLLVVDVTGDGKPDLVTANGDVGSVSVLRNQGNGKFAAKVDYVTGAGPFVRAVDLNGDEKVDLVTRNDSSQSVSVLLNLGDGTFTTKVDYPLVLLTPRLGPASFELADVNHDGKVDLVVSGVIDDPMFTRAVSVYLNTGGGVFAWEQNLQVLSDARALAVQDFNGDGNLDVAVEETDENAVTLWLGNGDGTFHNQLSYATLSESPLMLTADADGDGRPDLIVPGAPVTALINGLRGLAIQEQPSVVIPGEAFAVKVGVVNANGELLAGDHSSVTLEIASGPAGAVLGGTVTADVVGGVATFSDLVLAVAGRYSLRALSGSLRPATSAGLVVNAHRELHPTVAVAARGIVTENRMGVELSVLGADVAGEAVLTYRWAETGHSNSGPAPLFGEENGTNAAKNLEANVGVVGWHTFQVVIENGEGLIATSVVTVHVEPVATSLSFDNRTLQVKAGKSVSIGVTERDQFGDTMIAQPLDWSLSGGGTYEDQTDYGSTAFPRGPGKASLQFTAGATNGTYILTATRGAASATETITVTDGAPEVPTGLTAKALSGYSIQVAWTLHGDEAGVYVMRWNGSVWLNIAKLGAGATSFTDTGLKPSTHYIYDVIAYNAKGTTWAANYVSATTKTTLTPGIPTGLSAAALSYSSVKVSWKANGGQTSVVLKRWTGASWANVVMLGASATSYTVTGLLPNTKYMFDVVAGNAYGAVWAANMVSVTTFGKVAPPAATNLAFTQVSATSGRISWELHGNETKVMVAKWNGKKWLTIATLAAGSTSFVDPGLWVGAGFHYMVITANAFGQTWSTSYVTSKLV